jgi:glutaredoxin
MSGHPSCFTVIYTSGIIPISVRYFSLDKKSFTYDIDKGILQQRLGYVPTHAPVIFINGKEVKLSQLSQEIQDNL